MRKFSLFVIATILCIYCYSCKKDKTEPERESKIDINGTWVATGYTCIGNVPDEIISIVESSGEVTATKIVGDDCVPAGVVTFKGSYNSEKQLYEITWTTGTTLNPASDSAPGTLSVINKDSLSSTFVGNPSIAFRRQK